MITVKEALEVAQGRTPTKVELPELSEREQTQLDYLDAMVEGGICKSFVGEPFNFEVPAGAVEMVVLEALKRRYDEGGWLVGILPIGDGGMVHSFHLVFAPSGKLPTIQPKLPRVVAPAPLTALSVRKNRLLIRFPTRGRPARAIEVLEKYRTMAGCAVTIEVIIDFDDETMMNAEVQQRLAALDCVVTVGAHRSKIEACNAGRVKDWDIIMLASDDMVPVVDDYAVQVIDAMEGLFPHLDGAIFFNDRFQRSNLCTLPIFGRRLYDQFGYIYEPEYKSLFCDREQTDLLRAMGRLEYVDGEPIIEHHHHAWGRAEKDALYERNDALTSVDQATYERRKATRDAYSQWKFDAPPMWLSLLICTLPSRRRQLDWLVDHLYRQIIASAPRQVEILVDAREQPVSVGEKRQDLLERAKGHFVAFIDDDDGVSHDYIERIVSAIKRYPETDCVALNGIITSNGRRPEPFKHSITVKEWHTEGGVHYRSPNHISPVRRELALQVGFVPKNVGEDFDYSKRLQPLLKAEVSAGSDPLYFYWWDGSKSVQSAESKK